MILSFVVLSGVMLAVSTPNLSDLALTKPELADVHHGPTGVRIVKWLGEGGMSTVFLAEHERPGATPVIDADAPHWLAIKILKPGTLRDLERHNQREIALETGMREVSALEPIKKHRPPTEFVVGLYGRGESVAQLSGKEIELPWLALEYVDGGTAGATLAKRVERETEGFDPIRVERIVKRISEGLGIVHQHGVVHRDIKPENIFITGPVDDEIPKIGDFGIARLQGSARPGVTIAALTQGYGSSEQALSQARPGRSNPLIGPWTDVAALAAVVWFVIGGEDWYQGDDHAWNLGVRRSLREADRLHPGYAAERRLLDQIETVLARGAASRPPRIAWDKPGAQDYEATARALYGDTLWSGPERYASLDGLGQDLLPLLSECSRRWREIAIRQNRAVTAFRPTQFFSTTPGMTTGVAQVEPVAPPRFGWEVQGTLDPGCLVFQPDGKMLGKVGREVVYVSGERANRVAVPSELSALVASSTWFARGPEGGFAMVGPRHVVLVRAGTFRQMPLPCRPGGEVGDIEVVIGDGRVFGVVTAETDDSDGGPELWLSSDGAHWQEPKVLPLNGSVHAIAYGPYGYLVAGSRKGTRGRALSLGLDDKLTLYKDVKDGPPFSVAVSGALRESWAAGPGILMRFDRSAATAERAEVTEPPIAMGLDLVGIPWLLTPRTVLRRQEGAVGPVWKTYFRQPDDKPGLVGIGFTPRGAHVADEACGVVLVKPWDLGAWRSATNDGLG